MLRAVRLRLQPAASAIGGLLSFGHAAVPRHGRLRRARYAAKVWGLPPELGDPRRHRRGGAARRWSFGALAIRRQGIYFAMITLALAQMVYFFCLQAPFTGGEDGIQAVPRGTLFGVIDLADDADDVLLRAGDLPRRRSCSSTASIHSPFGQVLKAIRENEPRAISLGYDADRYKLLAFVLSAALAGLAGATKAIVFQLASLTDVHWTMSGEVVLMTLLGGMGTVFGPVVGAFVDRRHARTTWPASARWVTVIQGVIFVVCVLAFRRGIVGEIGAWWARRRP